MRQKELNGVDSEGLYWKDDKVAVGAGGGCALTGWCWKRSISGSGSQFPSLGQDNEGRKTTAVLAGCRQKSLLCNGN